MRVRFILPWGLDLNASERRSWPQGWEGSVDEEIALSAIADGCAESLDDGDSDDEAEDSRVMWISEGIAALDPDDPGLWTKTGKPDLKALESVLGSGITAKERDEAHQLYLDSR